MIAGGGAPAGCDDASDDAAAADAVAAMTAVSPGSAPEEDPSGSAGAERELGTPGSINRAALVKLWLRTTRRRSAVDGRASSPA